MRGWFPIIYFIKGHSFLYRSEWPKGSQSTYFIILLSLFIRSVSISSCKLSRNVVLLFGFFFTFRSLKIVSVYLFIQYITFIVFFVDFYNICLRFTFGYRIHPLTLCQGRHGVKWHPLSMKERGWPKPESVHSNWLTYTHLYCHTVYTRCRHSP